MKPVLRLTVSHCIFKKAILQFAFIPACVLSFLMAVSFRATAQSLTPSHSFVIEANTSTIMPIGWYNGAHFIFPNGKIGISMNDDMFRIYEPSGTLVQTIDMELSAGFKPRKVVGLTNNRLLLLNQTTFAIIDLQGNVILPETSTGFSNYFNNYNLDAVELSNGNLALSSYGSSSQPMLRVMTQAGAAVSGILDIKANGTGRPSPQFNQFYNGNLIACKDGGFLFAYRTYLMGIWGILLDNDGNLRTWPSTGLNHNKLSPGNQENFEATDLPNGSFMLQFPWNKTSNLIIDGNGNVVSSSVARAYNYGGVAVNRRASNGYYVLATPDENIGQMWDGSDDFTGNAGIYAEVRNPDGTQAIASTQIGTGYFDVQWNEDEYYYIPDIRPSVYSISSLRGASGYGMIVWNPLGGSNYSLTMNLYEINLSTLPVKLESFEGRKTQGGNLLEWTTSSEINASRFEVEYSETGIGFSRIGEVAAGDRDYEFLHTTAAPVAYYRLRSVDVDEKFDYSNIIMISSGVTNIKKASLFPVPAMDNFSIALSGFTAGDRYAYQIVNPAGSIVKRGYLTQQNQRIEIGNLKPGIYYVNIQDHETKKLLVK